MAKPPGLRRLSGVLSPEQLISALNPFLTDTSAALNAALTLKDNISHAIKDITVTMPDYPWTYVTEFLTAGVSNSGGAQVPTRYLVLPGGKLRLETSLTIPSTASAFGLFTMPEGYRPTYREPITAVANGAVVTPGRVFEASGGANAGLVFKESSSALTFFDARVEYYLDSASQIPAPVKAFEGPGWPIPLEVSNVQAPPVSVLTLSVEDLTAGSGTTVFTSGVSHPDWHIDSQGRIAIRSLYGLAPGHLYRIRFLIQF